MILDQIKEIISEQFNLDVEDLNEDTSFEDDLNADSIDLAHLVMSLEDEYGVEVEDEDIEDIKTIGNAADYIEDNLE